MITYGVLMLSYGHRLIVNDKDKYSKFPYNENLLEKDGKLESFDSWYADSFNNLISQFLYPVYLES